MPSLTRQQQILIATQRASSDQARPPTDYDTMEDSLWLVSQRLQAPDDHVELAAPTLGKTLSRKPSMDAHTSSPYGQADPLERYLSSEEEVSPSPDSDTRSQASDDSEEQSNAKDNGIDPLVESYNRDVDSSFEIWSEGYHTETAIAVAIKPMGPPRLVDITNFAPMQKRKRNSLDRILMTRPSIATSIKSESRLTAENRAPSSASSIRSGQTTFRSAQHQAMVTAPASWFPEEEEPFVETESLEAYTLETRPTPSYIDYDPYRLSPPCLSPRLSHSGPSKKAGAVLRGQRVAKSSSSTHLPSGFKSLTRSLSSAKRQEAYHPAKQIAKRPKMLAHEVLHDHSMPAIPCLPLAESTNEISQR